MSNDRVYYSHDAEMYAMRRRALLTLVFLMFGLGIGAALALLFAPSSGKNTRKSIEGGLKEGRDGVEAMVKRVEEEFDEVRKNVEERLHT